MGILNNGVNVAEYVYDFDVDGGTFGTGIALSAKNNKSAVPIGAVVCGVTAKVITAPTSEGSATVGWGDGSTADGYSGTTIAIATLVDNYVVNGWDRDASLLWDGNNDHPIYYTVTSAATGAFNILIGTADLTAGKIVFFVSYFEAAVDC